MNQITNNQKRMPSRQISTSQQQPERIGTASNRQLGYDKNIGKEMRGSK